MKISNLSQLMQKNYLLMMTLLIMFLLASDLGTSPIKLNRLEEIHRVLKPKGKLIVIDFSKPTNAIIRNLNSIYLNYYVPVVAKMIAGNISEYKYLAKSIVEHPTQAEIVEMMINTGFSESTYKNKLNGIIAIHVSEK